MECEDWSPKVTIEANKREILHQFVSTRRELINNSVIN